MKSQTNVLVIGATGKVGSEVVELLQNKAQVNVVAAVRSNEQRERFASKSVDTTFFDFDDLQSIQSAVTGIDSLLLLTGYTVDMMRHSKRVIDSAKQAGVKHIVHIGASGNPTTEVAHWGWHKMIEAYIEQQGFSYTHLRPEAFMQNITAFGWLQKDSLTSLIGDAVWSWVDVRDVAAIAAEALAEPEHFKGQVIELGYHAATIEDVSEYISNALGVTLSVADADANDFYNGAVQAGADPAYMACIRDQFLLNKAGKIDNADKVFDAQVFEQAVGRKPYAWSDYMNHAKDELNAAINAA